MNAIINHWSVRTVFFCVILQFMTLKQQFSVILLTKDETRLLINK